MSIHKVGNYLLKGNEYDVFHKLYWSGLQEDDNIPSKVGMDNLILKGLAEKIDHPKPNQLTKKGYLLARTHFNTKK